MLIWKTYQREDDSVLDTWTGEEVRCIILEVAAFRTYDVLGSPVTNYCLCQTIFEQVPYRKKLCNLTQMWVLKCTYRLTNTTNFNCLQLLEGRCCFLPFHTDSYFMAFFIFVVLIEDAIFSSDMFKPFIVPSFSQGNVHLRKDSRTC